MDPSVKADLVRCLGTADYKYGPMKTMTQYNVLDLMLASTAIPLHTTQPCRQSRAAALQTSSFIVLLWTLTALLSPFVVTPIVGAVEMADAVEENWQVYGSWHQGLLIGAKVAMYPVKPLAGLAVYCANALLWPLRSFIHALTVVYIAAGKTWELARARAHAARKAQPSVDEGNGPAANEPPLPPVPPRHGAEEPGENDPLLPPYSPYVVSTSVLCALMSTDN